MRKSFINDEPLSYNVTVVQHSEEIKHEPNPEEHAKEHVASEKSVPKPPADDSSWKSVVSTLILFAAAILIAFFVKAFIVQPYIVDGQSMENTLQNNDRLIVNKIPRTLARIDGHSYIPKRGNIIIFNQSGLPGYNGSKQLIKRVIGLPGERVVVKDNNITIYNSTHPNGFNPDATLKYHIVPNSTLGSVDIKLGPNQVFVCGDNRENSEDSRYFGPVDVKNIVGKLVLRIMPISKFESF